MMRRFLAGLAGLAVAACSAPTTSALAPAPPAISEPTATALEPRPTAAPRLPRLGPAPELTNEIWLNTDAPLRLADLRGKVVLIDFWTFG